VGRLATGGGLTRLDEKLTVWGPWGIDQTFWLNNQVIEPSDLFTSWFGTLTSDECAGIQPDRRKWKGHQETAKQVKLTRAGISEGECWKGCCSNIEVDDLRWEEKTELSLWGILNRFIEYSKSPGTFTPGDGDASFASRNIGDLGWSIKARIPWVETKAVFSRDSNCHCE